MQNLPYTREEATPLGKIKCEIKSEIQPPQIPEQIEIHEQVCPAE